MNIGDGSQKDLVDHINKVMGNRNANFVNEFVSATRELRAKEKIYIPEKKVQAEKEQPKSEMPKRKEKGNHSLDRMNQELEQAEKENEKNQNGKEIMGKGSQEQTHNSDSEERC